MGGTFLLLVRDSKTCTVMSTEKPKLISSTLVLHFIYLSQNTSDVNKQPDPDNAVSTSTPEALFFCSQICMLSSLSLFICSWICLQSGHRCLQGAAIKRCEVQYNMEDFQLFSKMKWKFTECFVFVLWMKKKNYLSFCMVVQRNKGKN